MNLLVYSIFLFIQLLAFIIWHAQDHNPYLRLVKLNLFLTIALMLLNARADSVVTLLVLPISINFIIYYFYANYLKKHYPQIALKAWTLFYQVFLSILSPTISNDLASQGKDLFDILLVILISGLMTLLPLAVYHFYVRFIDSNKRSPSNINKKKNKKMFEHYQKQGLSQDEIILFRQEMAQAKDTISTIEASFAQTAKIKMIINKYQVIEVCQNYFQQIVQKPKKITQANHFLYDYLPSIADLISKYNEISLHVAKDKQTYQILERTALTIEELSKKICDDYIQFHQDLYDDTQSEIDFINQQLHKD
ncbi:5-bromo-4-chloroindolyl phosphate hydrolysis family protein [Hutsoniella sourekii]|uniref:5-bromo-4-chloroindolyl phosphate hydrolysis family protein n=1 Tax=Hutsoniella sourekii TaxID=87650 RepID=UPI0004BAB867|nr:5-bromo-4-chloroindolyl phosphate hydrolysis family protein [Hutsoniella sourekii]